MKVYGDLNVVRTCYCEKCGREFKTTCRTRKYCDEHSPTVQYNMKRNGKAGHEIRMWMNAR